MVPLLYLFISFSNSFLSDMIRSFILLHSKQCFHVLFSDLQWEQGMSCIGLWLFNLPIHQVTVSIPSFTIVNSFHVYVFKSSGLSSYQLMILSFVRSIGLLHLYLFYSSLSFLITFLSHSFSIKVRLPFFYLCLIHL